MSNAERRLAELFAADLPPPADRAFALAVLARIERRKMWRDVIELTPLALAAAVLLWALAPDLVNLAKAGFSSLNSPVFFTAIALTLAVLAFIGIDRGREEWEL